MKKLVLLLFLFVITINAQFEGFTPSLSVQETEIYKSNNQYQQDFLYLCEGLEKFHVNIFKYFKREDFEKEKSIIFKKLESCTNEDDFVDIAQMFLNKAKDSSTKIRNSLIYRTGFHNYPFECEYFADSLVITNVTSQIPIEFVGMVIKSINGISVQEMEKRLSDIICVQNYQMIKHYMTLIEREGFLKLINVIQDDSSKIVVEVSTNKKFEVFPNSNEKYLMSYPLNRLPIIIMDVRFRSL